MTNFFDLMQNIVNALNVVVRAQDRTVRVDKQNFTEEQKAQARKNIGIYDLIISDASGETIVLTDSTNNKLEGLTLYGKTTQNGTPTPEAPVELVSAGEDGDITVTISGEDVENQALTVSTPNGLAGVPVASGGNYTDSNGQQWICDEVDFTRGVYVQRVGKVVLDGSDDERWNNSMSTNAPYGANINNLSGAIADCTNNDTRIICDRYPTATIAESWAAREYLISRISTTDRHVCFRNTTISSLTEWIADVSANPITVRYILATPIETPLTAEQLLAYAALHTNYPTTTIVNDSGAGMSVSYVASTKNYIDNQVAAVSAAILNL